MKRNAFVRRVHLVLAILVVLFVPHPMTAQVPAGDSTGVPNFDVVSTKNVDRVEGVNGTTIVWRDTTRIRGVILLVRTTLPVDTVFWNTDFSLAYARGEIVNDRARARGISTVSNTADAEGAWLIGEQVRVPVQAGTRYFRVLFDLEQEVTEVALQFARPVTHHVAVVMR